MKMRNRKQEAIELAEAVVLVVTSIIFMFSLLILF